MTDLFPEVRVDPTVDLDRRYTTRETMNLCMGLADVSAWDLDVAADEESHWAPLWFGVEANGLAQPWFGNVWCNPPFSNLEPWLVKAWFEFVRGNCSTIAMLLPANRTEQPFWQEHVERHRDRHDSRLRTYFLPTRVRFGHPGNRDGVRAGSPPFGCVLLVWGR